jgi:mono/diheme cytochrome c family protein
MGRNVRSNWKRRLSLALALVVAAGPNAAAAQGAAGVYAQKCAECHGTNGQGDGPAGRVMVPPPAPFATTLKGKSDRWIDSVITQGGPAVGLSPGMPSHPNLSASQVNALTQYIKGLNS